MSVSKDLFTAFSKVSLQIFNSEVTLLAPLVLKDYSFEGSFRLCPLFIRNLRIGKNKKKISLSSY